MSTPHPSKYLQQTEDAVKKACFIVQKLTSSKEEMKASLPRGTESMPISELHFCKGLAFTFVKKAGIGISAEHGYGFVISKLPGDSADSSHPSWTWSAPMFVECYAGGVGLTLGFSEIDSVVVLDTPEAVQGWAHTQVTLDTDITGAIGSSVGTHLPATAANMTDIKLSDKTFTYSICKGAMVDVSLTGMGYTVDASMNTALYGPNTTPNAILEGGVEPPPAMKELYQVLDHALRNYYTQVHAAAAAPQAEEAGTSAAAAGAAAEPVAEAAATEPAGVEAPAPAAVAEKAEAEAAPAAEPMQEDAAPAGEPAAA